MSAQPEFGFERLVTQLLRGVADAVADRPGDNEAQRFNRQQTVIFSVMAFLPRDAMETMLAGQCVMFDHLLRDATRELLCCEAEPVKLRLRSQVTALARSFLRHLGEYRLLQARHGSQPEASSCADPQPASDPGGEPAEVGDAAPRSGDSGSPPANAEPQPNETASSDSADRLMQDGFHNRRMRRALQFKKSSGRSARKPPSLGSGVPRSATGAGARTG